MKSLSKELLAHLSLDVSEATLAMLPTADKMMPMLTIPGAFDNENVTFAVDPKLTNPLFNQPVDGDIEMKDGDLESIVIPKDIQKYGVATLKIQSVRHIFEQIKKTDMKLRNAETSTLVLLITQETGIQMGFIGARNMDPRTVFVLGKGRVSHEVVELFDGRSIGRQQLDMLFEDLAFIAEETLHDNPQVRSSHVAKRKPGAGEMVAPTSGYVE